MRIVRKARREVAQWSPNLWYIWTPKSGKIATTSSVSTSPIQVDQSSLEKSKQRHGREGRVQHTTKTTPGKTISCQCRRCIKWVCINKIGKNPREDKDGTIGEKFQLAYFSCSFIHGGFLRVFLRVGRTTRYVRVWKRGACDLPACIHCMYEMCVCAR